MLLIFVKKNQIPLKFYKKMSIYTKYIQLGIICMTVGAINTGSSRHLYSTYTEYQYFGTTVSQERLNDLMARYGIQQTGNSDEDLRALYVALYRESIVELEEEKSTEMSVNQNSQSTQANQTETTTEVPWSTIMGQVGLMVTGDYDADYAAFETRINSMQYAAVTQQEKASIDQLIAEAAVAFVPPEQSVHA